MDMFPSSNLRNTVESERQTKIFTFLVRDTSAGSGLHSTDGCSLCSQCSVEHFTFYTSYNLHLKQKHHFPTDSALWAVCPAGDCNDEFLSQSPLVLLSSHFTIPDPLCSTFHKQIKINKQWHEYWERCDKTWEMHTKEASIYEKALKIFNDNDWATWSWLVIMSSLISHYCKKMLHLSRTCRSISEKTRIADLLLVCVVTWSKIFS